MKLAKFRIPILVFSIFFFLTSSTWGQILDKDTFDPSKRYGQSYIDSLIQHPERNYKNIPMIKKILEKDPNLYGWPLYYLKKTGQVYRNNNFDSVIYYADKGIESYRNAKLKRELDEEQLIPLNLIKANVLKKQKKYKSSINHYQAALDLTKKYPYKWNSYLLVGIAQGHLAMGNDSIALDYFLKVSKDTLYMNLGRPASITCSSIGLLFEKFEQAALAKEYFLKGIEVSYRTEYYDNIHLLNYNLGHLSYRNKKIDSALHYYKKGNEAYNIYGFGNYKDGPLNQKMASAFINVHEGTFNQGIQLLKEILVEIEHKTTHSKFDMSNYEFGSELLVLAYDKKGNNKKAIEVLSNEIVFIKDFHKKQLLEDMQNLEISFQAKEKDASIEQLEINRAQQQIIINQQRYLSFGLAGLLLLLVVIGIVLWRQRSLNDQYKLENLEQRLLRSQMNPHFVSNALNSACGLVESQSSNTIPYLIKLATLFRLILTNSRQEFVSLDEELVLLKNYLELQSGFSNKFGFKIAGVDTVDSEAVVIPPMLIQPFIENAIVHGLAGIKEKGQIELEVFKPKNDGLLHIRIMDNGLGYPMNATDNKTTNRKSISGNIVAERLAILKKKFQVQTRFLISKRVPQGTIIDLYLPYLME